MAVVPVDSTFGVMLCGAFVAFALFGTSIVQVYVYFSRFTEDLKLVRAFVYWLLVLDVLHIAFIGGDMYELLVSNWGDQTKFDDVPIPQHLEVLTNGIIVFCVQIFFTYRVWVLSRRRNWLAVILIILAFIQLACACFFGAVGFGQQHFTAFHQWTGWLILWTATDVLTGGLIAGILCYYLYKSRDGTEKVHRVIDTLMVFTINTGLLTSTCALLHLVFFVASPNTSIHFAFHFLLGKMYTNSVYASLNARTVLRSREATAKSHISFEVELSTATDTRRSQPQALDSVLDIKADSVNRSGHLPSPDSLPTSSLHRGFDYIK